MTDDLMRFADGETDPATTARIAAAIAGDPAMAAEVTRYRTLYAAAAEAFDEALAETIPDRLLALLRPAATVADIATAHVART